MENSKLELTSDEVKQIQKEVDQAIKKGLDATRIEWRRMALEVLLKLCLTKEYFSANDFTPEILKLPIKTHDNRAIGGIIMKARSFGWIVGTGRQTPSRAARLRGAEIWKSQLYEKAPKQVPQPQQEGFGFDIPTNKRNTNQYGL